MRRPRFLLHTALTMSFATLAVISPGAVAGTEIQPWSPAVVSPGEFVHDGPGSLLFKIQANHNVFEYSEGMRDYKRPPKVDSKLVGQIMQVRTAMPSWRGIPHLMPGSSAAAP